jgi:hypothetical protein
MKIFTFLDYDEVYHNMLECYFIQPVRKMALDAEPSNDVKTSEIGSIATQLSTKGDNCEKGAPHKFVSENSHASTLCDYGTTITIRDNAYAKNKVAKGF